MRITRLIAAVVICALTVTVMCGFKTVSEDVKVEIDDDFKIIEYITAYDENHQPYYVDGNGAVIPREEFGSCPICGGTVYRYIHPDGDKKSGSARCENDDFSGTTMGDDILDVEFGSDGKSNIAKHYRAIGGKIVLMESNQYDNDDVSVGLHGNMDNEGNVKNYKIGFIKKTESYIKAMDIMFSKIDAMFGTNFREKVGSMK